MTKEDSGKLLELAAELVRTIEEAGRGYSIRLTRLVDDEAEYTLTYRGEQGIWDSHEEASEHLQRLTECEKVEAALAFLARAHTLSGEPIVELTIIDALRLVVGDAIGDKTEARERFLEESHELAQAAGGTLEEAIWSAQQVFAKPIDPVGLEVGQVSTALHRLAFAHGVDVVHEAESDRKHIVANAKSIRERHARKARFPTPSADLKADNAALVEEITRLRSLLIDPGSPAWEDARAVLVAELRKCGLGMDADGVANGQFVEVPSHIALDLIAHCRQAFPPAQTNDT